MHVEEDGKGMAGFGLWDDTLLSSSSSTASASELLTVLSTRLYTLRYYCERNRRRLHHHLLPPPPSPLHNDGSRRRRSSSSTGAPPASWGGHDKKRETSVEEHAQVTATLRKRFGPCHSDKVQQPPWPSTSPPPLVSPTVFLSVMDFLGGWQQGKMSGDAEEGGGCVGATARRVEEIATQLLCFLPDVGRGDVLADALLVGQARSCRTHLVAADYGVLLVPHEIELDGAEEEIEDSDDEDSLRSSGSSRRAGEYGSEAAGRRQLRRQQGGAPSLRRRYGDILLAYQSAAHTERLRTVFANLARAPSPSSSESTVTHSVLHAAHCRCTTLRVLLTLPPVRTAFIMWHCERRKLEKPYVLFSAGDLWPGDAPGVSVTLLTALRWEVLLRVFPDPSREPWDPAILTMTLQHFQSLVLSVTGGGDPQGGGRRESNETARWYALVLLKRLTDTAAWLRYGDDSLSLRFAHTVLTSPAITCFCMETLASCCARRAGSGNEAGRMDDPVPRARPPPARSGSSVSDLARDILTSVVDHLAWCSAGTRSEGGGDSDGNGNEKDGRFAENGEKGEWAASGKALRRAFHLHDMPSSSAIRRLLSTNRPQLLAMLTLLEGQGNGAFLLPQLGPSAPWEAGTDKTAPTAKDGSGEGDEESDGATGAWQGMQASAEVSGEGARAARADAGWRALRGSLERLKSFPPKE